MQNIVYLLGAGASYNSIPIVNTFAIRLELFLAYLKSLDKFKDKDFTIYDKIIEEIVYFGTPDTLAKKFYLSDDHKLFDLKNLITSFILFEQLKKNEQWEKTYVNFKPKFGSNSNWLNGTHNELDTRYLSFIATIAKKSKEYRQIEFGNNISIISWNYDLQFERAYQEYTERELYMAQKDLNVYPCIDGEINEIEEKVKNNFSILKLNESAGFYRKEEPARLFDLKYHELNNDTLDIFENALFGARSNYMSLLNFAWETNNERVVKARKLARDLIHRARIIVIIGYSFPDFNRFIDKDIFANLSSPKIYYQDPLAEKLTQKLKGVNDEFKEVVTDTNTDNFILPFEFWE